MAGGVLGEEVFEGLGGEVVEDCPLAFFPGLVQGAGGALSAGAILDDTAGDAEWPLHRFHGFPERDLVGGSRKP